LTFSSIYAISAWLVLKDSAVISTDAEIK